MTRRNFESPVLRKVHYREKIVCYSEVRYDEVFSKGKRSSGRREFRRVRDRERYVIKGV